MRKERELRLATTNPSELIESLKLKSTLCCYLIFFFYFCNNDNHKWAIS